MPWDEGLVNSLVYDRPDPNEGRVVSYARAINEALAIALQQDPNVFVLGQGVDDMRALAQVGGNAGQETLHASGHASLQTGDAGVFFGFSGFGGFA